MTQLPGLEMSLERALSLCAFCPKMCHAVCPVYLADKRESHSPWGKMWQGYRAVVHGEKLDSASAALFEYCTGCGACTAYCEHGVEVAEVLHFLRGESLSSGLRTQSERVITDFDAGLNEVPAAFVDWHRQHHPAQHAGSLQAERSLLWAGADSAGLRPGLAALTQQLLRDLGIEVDLLAAELYPDLGQRLYWTGQSDRLRLLAQQVAKSVQAWQEIICIEAEDAFMLKGIFPRHGVEVTPRVFSLVEVLDMNSEHLPRQDVPVPLYHDPATLARHLGQIEAPRRLIEKVCGQSPHEFVWHQAQCMNAGSGAGFELQYPELAENMAKQRWADRGINNDELLVTASAKQEALFIRAGLTCVDLVEWISSAFLPDVQALIESAQKRKTSATGARHEP